MCVRNTYYPLVYLPDGKRKVMFNYGIKVVDRDSMELVSIYSKEFQKAKIGISNYQSLNNLFAKNQIERIDKMIQVPCGCCRECLADNSKQWAFRILKEAAQYENNYFITITYNEDNLPKDHMLEKDFFTKFNKKLKVYLARNGLRSDYRFYGVGEYGSKTARPHYHCIFFNLDLQDLKFEYIDSNHNLHFSSKLFSQVWDKGFVDIGSVDIGSACYVARYCDKKRRLTTSEKQELVEKGIVPEFSAMSRMPGIGACYTSEALDNFINGKYYDVQKGQTFKLPLYYTKKFKEILKDTPELARYEEHAKNSASIVIANQLELSDFIDLESYKEDSDVLRSKRGL